MKFSKMNFEFIFMIFRIIRVNETTMFPKIPNDDCISSCFYLRHALTFPIQKIWYMKIVLHLDTSFFNIDLYINSLGVCNTPKGRICSST